VVVIVVGLIRQVVRIVMVAYAGMLVAINRVLLGVLGLQPVSSFFRIKFFSQL